MSAVVEPQAFMAAVSPTVITHSEHDPIALPPQNHLALELKMAIDSNGSLSDFASPTLQHPIAQHTTPNNYSKLEPKQTDSVNAVSEQLPTTSLSSICENPASIQASQYEEDERMDEEQEETAPNGEKTKFLNVGQKRKFQEWIGKHSENLYPTRDEKLGLVKLLGASYLQVRQMKC